MIKIYRTPVYGTYEGSEVIYRVDVEVYVFGIRVYLCSYFINIENGMRLY